MERKIQLRRWVNPASRRFLTAQLAIFSLIVFWSTPILTHSQSSTRVITAKWLDQPPVIDGVLSESVWQKAETATNFFYADRTSSVPAKLNTQAMVLYDENTLYVGMRCDEPNMKNLRQTQTRRDDPLWSDDNVQVLLDTYNDQRNCYVLAINTLGTQMDAKISNESNVDRSWDAKWKANVKKNGNHWTAEMAVPFRELRFDPRTTTWGINFWRPHPMDEESYSWSDTGGRFSRVSEFGKLTNLDFSQVDTSRKIGILPYVTQRSLENQGDDADTGLDLIIPISTNITTNVTFNPDFSQLESDPTRINISSDQELYLPERRPFFREGADLFKLPLNLFYTRRVQEIDYGVKSTGKVSDYNFAFINTYGRMIDRYDDNTKKTANLFAARVNRNIGERTVVGVMGIQKHQIALNPDLGTNRDVTLLSFDGRLALHRDWMARSQYVMDFLDGEMHWAYHTSMYWRHGSGWGGDIRLEEIQDGFRPNETGFEDEAFRVIRSRLRYRHRFAEGSLVRSFYLSGSHVYQTNAQQLLRERRIGLSGRIDFGKLDFYSFGGIGVQREDEGVFDRKYFGSQMRYRSKWGHLGLYNRFRMRQGESNRYTSFYADANLFSKLTIDLNISNFFWRDNQNTLIFRFRGNYQFTRRIGWRMFVERVDERLEDEVNYNFNSLFDYQFTPESRFFFVFVNSTSGERAVLTKMSYLFESDLPF